MKKSFFLLLVLMTIGPWVFGQHPVILQMNQKLGDLPFAHNTPVQASAGYYLKIDRLQYYISEIRLIHDGGQVTSLTDLHFLVTPIRNFMYDLGSAEVTDVEKIEFSIGVDPAHNHLDPATYPIDHPLAPQNPSMHWGWTAGYRFIAFEGFGSTNGSTFPNNFQIHTVDDTNYKTVTIDVEEEMQGDTIVIPIQADYLRLLDNVDVSAGLISHSSIGASKTIMENMAEHVFTGATSSSTIEPGVKGSLSVSPNPSSGEFTITYAFPGLTNLQMRLTDMAGITYLTQALNADAASQKVSVRVASGIYYLLIQANERVIAMEKIMIY